MATRRSRFTTEPRGVGFRITDGDIAILELLARFRFLPSSYLLAFLARRRRNTEYAKHRLTTLRHEARLIDCPAASWSAANSRYRPAVYMLTARGTKLLADRGKQIRPITTGRAFRHELMVALVHASMALGVEDDPDLSFITADDILRHSSCPPETVRLPDPFRMPISFTYRSAAGSAAVTVDTTLRHDGEPFAIGCRAGDGRIVRLFFPGIEADRRTEPLSPRDHNRSSIHRHLSKILEATRTGLYRRHLGIPNALVPVITTSAEHMRGMIDLLLEISGGRGSSNVLFKSVSDFSSFETFPTADGHMLTEPWHRAGHEPLNVVAELKKAS